MREKLHVFDISGISFTNTTFQNDFLLIEIVKSAENNDKVERKITELKNCSSNEFTSYSDLL